MIRFGIVGFGLHAVKRLMPGFAASERCRVTALQRRDPAKAQASAHEYQIPHAFTSVKDLCQCPEVDAVLVTSPNSVHLPDVLAAIDARKPVLCEKPMAMHATECRQMVEAAAKANVLLGLAHVMRFEDSVRIFRERVAAGDIGRPVFAHCNFSFFAPPNHPRVWLHDRSLAGGGPIADIGVHCIDTLRFVLQDEVVRVTARAHSDNRAGDVESAATLILEFSLGTLGTVSVSYRSDYHTPMEILGDNGSLRSNDALTVDYPITIDLIRDHKLIASDFVSNDRVYTTQVDQFAQAIETGSDFLIPGEEGWQNQEILDAAYRSIQSGKTEDVPRVVRRKVRATG